MSTSRTSRSNTRRRARACSLSITTIRSATDTPGGVSRFERYFDRSRSRAAATSTAIGEQGRPHPTKPADSTRIALCADCVSSRSNSAAAYGLRQMLPWHTTNTTRGGGEPRSRPRALRRRSG